MSWIIRFFRNLLFYTPREIIIALFLLLYILLILLLLLLLWLWDWLRERLANKNLYPEETDEPCGRLPEGAIRRPDPCIYSQTLLMSQGLPVTWNNPDIWVAPASDPAAIEPDSYHLKDDTDYIASVLVHNASTDAAIGVRVRLNYRPWSFGSPNLTPVEEDTGGNEVVRFVNIAPMGNAVTQFNWHTPKLEAGEESRHYCLQASVYHPLDINTANNMGQENTQVHRTDNPGFVNPGDTVDLQIPLFNPARQRQQFRFAATMYAIDDGGTYRLHLKTSEGRVRMSLSRRLANTVPRLHRGKSAVQQVEPKRAAVRSGFKFENRNRLKSVKTRYVGYEELTKKLLAADHSLPQGMTVTADGAPIDEGITLEARGEHAVRFELKVPDAAAPGATFPVNLVALTADGRLAGGVTVILKVRD